MRITGSVETDSANYKVKVINIHGSTSIDTKLNVRGAPKILKNLQDITANEHDKNVELNVEIESYPKSKVKWYLDEMEISESRCEFTRIESDNGSKLVIKEVTSELSGQYCCKVINELGGFSYVFSEAFLWGEIGLGTMHPEAKFLSETCTQRKRYLA